MAEIKGTVSNSKDEVKPGLVVPPQLVPFCFAVRTTRYFPDRFNLIIRQGEVILKEKTQLSAGRLFSFVEVRPFKPIEVEFYQHNWIKEANLIGTIRIPLSTGLVSHRWVSFEDKSDSPSVLVFYTAAEEGEELDMSKMQISAERPEMPVEEKRSTSRSQPMEGIMLRTEEDQIRVLGALLPKLTNYWRDEAYKLFGSPQNVRIYTGVTTIPSAPSGACGVHVAHRS